jgi:hypothetical protein
MGLVSHTIVFTADGLYYPPTGLRSLQVILRGAGGGAGKGGGGGGAAVATRKIGGTDLTRTGGVYDPVEVVVGAGGAGGTTGAPGGASSFGDLVCPGGEGGTADGMVAAVGGCSVMRGGAGGSQALPNGGDTSSGPVRLLAGGGGGGYPGGPGLGRGGASGLVFAPVTAESGV